MPATKTSIVDAGSGNRIIPARMPWVAATNPTQTKPATLAQSIFLQGFHRVVRTTREIPAAVSQPRAYRKLIATYQPKQGPDDARRLHLPGTAIRTSSESISPRQFFNCCFKFAFLIAETGRFRRKTTSNPTDGTAIKRKASLPCRLIALRSEAARAKRFGTIKPNLACAGLLVSRTCRSKLSPLMDLRAESTAENSRGRCRRRSAWNRALGSDAESMTAFGTTRTNHGTTATGTHAYEKAVSALAAHDRWLIGAFHDKFP